MSCLPESFFEQDVTLVARQLLGMRLVRSIENQRISGIIVEAEAYRGEEDLACHAKSGRTPRTAVMYGRPGRAYVYFTYGMHWMLNAVSGPEGFPSAVLIRAIIPVEGIEFIASRRAGRLEKEWCNGPAKICQSLAIDGTLNGFVLCENENFLRIEEGKPIPDTFVKTGPRIGLGNTPEPWLSKPWRFLASLDGKNN
jgi:DNA-3-methyladenine glycosylase